MAVPDPLKEHHADNNQIASDRKAYLVGWRCVWGSQRLELIHEFCKEVVDGLLLQQASLSVA